MKKINSFFSFIFPVIVLLVACNGQTGLAGQTGHALKGTFANAADLKVVFEQAHLDRNVVEIASTTCDANGKFELKFDKPFEIGIYRIRLGNKMIFFTLDGEENVIELTGDFATVDKMDFQIKGSKSFSCYADILKGLIQNPLTNMEDAKLAVAKGCSPLMRTFLATQLYARNAEPMMDDLRALQTEMTKAMPGSRYTTDFSTMMTNMEAHIAKQKAGGTAASPSAASGPIQVGMMAPEISLPGPDGKVRSLSSLRGKVVLLDFWASWCGPCRRENPHVVEVYKKYKSKGFDVFSVSLDKADGKDRWVQAIQQDGLLWDNHVSDLKFWNCAPAGVYGVRSIPSTFLIGKDGKIVALNPRNTLEQELLKVL